MAFLEDNPYKLESKYSAPYDLWKRNPTPSNAGALLKTVQPEIERGISAHVGQSNPILKSRARRMALTAIKSYDPSRARLGTHIVNQLQGLKRVSRQQTQILPIPERVSIDRNNVERTKAELGDELGREPNLDELADKTGLSVRRLSYIQKFRYPIAEGTIDHRMSQEEGAGFMPAVQQKDSDSWTQFVYSDLDNTNKKIMEWTLGMHDQPVLSNLAIAKKLQITPGAVSQRKAIIQKVLDQQELSPF